MPTIIFAGGGTGGHLYPGLAIAEMIREALPAARSLFLCSDREIDRRILIAEGVDFQIVPAKPLVLKPKSLVQFLLALAPSIRASRRMLREAVARDATHQVIVLAMGGFVAAPVVQAARAEKLPIWLINLDAVPGKANLWISRHADRTYAVAGAQGHPNWQPIRPVVRRAAVTKLPPSDCRAALGLDPDLRTLFVTGGSQGAGSINNLMIALAMHSSSAFAGWQVLHQAGEKGEAAVQAAYESAGITARVMAYCRDMGLAWAASDLAVTRCGAGAVAEVWANGVPAVFLPYPYHRDEHQRHNARPLTESSGTLIHTDHIDPERNRADGGTALEALLRAPDRLVAMRQALRSLGPADGAITVANEIVGSFRV